MTQENLLILTPLKRHVNSTAGNRSISDESKIEKKIVGWHFGYQFYHAYKA